MQQLIVSPEIIRIVKHAGVAMPAPEDAEAFGPFFDRFGDARVVPIRNSSATISRRRWPNNSMPSFGSKRPMR